jgi:quinol monooxygenase YgiN
MTSTAKIVAILDAREGKSEELRALLLGMVAPVRAEPGNLRWDIWTDPDRPGRFVLDELYVDRAAIAAHRQTPHFLSYVSRIGDLAERTAIVVDPVEVSE